MTPAVKLAMQVLVTVVLLAAGFWIVLHTYSADVTKAAFGWIGLAAGYWLR